MRAAGGWLRERVRCSREQMKVSTMLVDGAATDTSISKPQSLEGAHARLGEQRLTSDNSDSWLAASDASQHSRMSRDRHDGEPMPGAEARAPCSSQCTWTNHTNHRRRTRPLLGGRSRGLGARGRLCLSPLFTLLIPITLGYFFSATSPSAFTRASAQPDSTTQLDELGQRSAASGSAASEPAEYQQKATTTSIMTLAAGASLQHQQSALAADGRGQEADLDNSISGGLSSAPSASTAKHNHFAHASAEQQPQVLAALASSGSGAAQQQSFRLAGSGARWSMSAAEAGAQLATHQQPSVGSPSSVISSAASSRRGAPMWQSQNMGKLMKYLSEHQQELVKQNPGSILAVARGIKLAIFECQYQLQNEPWDCPIHGFSIKPTEVFGMLMSRSFKETSFVQALLSSAIAHAVARACTEGQIATCSRKKDPHDNDFAEDIDFGRQFAKNFMQVTHELQLYQRRAEAASEFDQRRRRATSNSASQQQLVGEQQLKQAAASAANERMTKERRIRYLINAHNDDVGLLTVYNGMMKECKCHGLSGACTMQTCWKRLPKFRDVANKLRDSFDQALRVEMSGGSPQASSSLALSRHKSSLAAAAAAAAAAGQIGRKSNKKRSSYTHKASSIAAAGLGRSSPSSPGRAGSIHGSLPLAFSSIASTPTESSTSASSRLRAYLQDEPPNLANKASQQQQLQTTENSLADNQAERDYAYNSMFTSSTPASPLINSTTLIRRRPVARSIGLSASIVLPNKNDLLYAEESPDFCVPNERYNIKGTKGRVCSENRHASNNCERLCCGRGYKTEIREEVYSCNCNFKFCCKLHCKTCKRPKIVHKCL